MTEDDIREAQRLLKEFKDSEFQLPLEKMKREQVTVGSRQMFKDLYLCERLFPALLEGLEELAKEVEQQTSESSDIDEEVGRRFNPCIFLGQYLMRNNHNAKAGHTSLLNKLFTKYVRQEQFSRFFLLHFDSISKIFIRSVKKDKKVCDLAEMRVFARDLDDTLGFKGELRDWLTSSKVLAKNKFEIKLTEIVDEIARFSAHNQTITEEDFLRIFKK